MQKYGLSYSFITHALWFIARTLLPCRRIEVNYVLEAVKDVKGKRILDFGCNTGCFTHLISQKGQVNEVCGADINTHALQYARKRYKDLIFYEVTEEFFQKHTFDIIVISHVLEHIKERKEFIGNIAKILADDGRLIVVVPQERVRGDATLFQILYNVIRFRFENPHIAMVHYNDLEKLFATIGYRIDSSIYTNYLFPFKSDSLRFHSWSLGVEVVTYGECNHYSQLNFHLNI